MSVLSPHEMDVLDRVLKRGDLTVLGLPVGDIASIYKLVNEWYALDGTDRDLATFRRREQLANALRDVRQKAESIVEVVTEVLGDAH